MRFYLVTVVASLGGLLFGYDTGVISGALLFIKHDFDLSAAMQGVVTSIVLAGATLGAAGAGSLSDRFGRRRPILGAATLFVIGALISAVAPMLWILIAGRFVVGLAIGVASMLTPLYLAEVASAKRRGATVSLNQFCITLGILVAYVVGYGLAGAGNGWRWMLGLGAVPGLVLGLGMLFLPESPRWLIGHGHAAQAERSLRSVRGRADVSAEMNDLRASLRREGSAASWGELFARRVRRPLIVGVGLAVLQQVTGINTVIYYAPTIFESAGLSSASVSILATAGVGVVNLVLTVAAMWLLDVTGRRRLLLAGLAGMVLSLCALGAVSLIGPSGALAWATVLSLAAYVGSFAIGLGPVFWLLISELFPLSVRGRGMGVATVCNWGSNLVVALFFPDLIKVLGQGPTFLLFAALSVAAWLFTWWLVPETKGRSLEQIEAGFAGAASQR